MLRTHPVCLCSWFLHHIRGDSDKRHPLQWPPHTREVHCHYQNCPIIHQVSLTCMYMYNVQCTGTACTLYMAVLIWVYIREGYKANINKCTLYMYNVHVHACAHVQCTCTCMYMCIFNTLCLDAICNTQNDYYHFLRFGSFEIFKTRDRETGRVGPSVGRPDILHQLLDFVTQSYYPQVHVHV